MVLFTSLLEIMNLVGSEFHPRFDTLIEYEPGKLKLRTKNGINYFFEDSTHQRLTKISDSDT